MWVSHFGPDDRALFETRATELYDEALASGGLQADDPRLTSEPEVREAFDLLVRLGLLTLDTDDQVWQAVDPATVQAQVVSPMGTQAAELLAESTQWARAFAGLGQTWRRSSPVQRGPITEITGLEAIGAFLASAVADAEEELLTAQPQGQRNNAGLKAYLDDVARRDTAALERGVKMRTLYQHSARRSTGTQRWVAAVTAHGAEVRTLDEFFNRLIVIDRRIAVIPGAGGPGSALVIREPNLLAYLVDMFERTWERAQPWTSRGSAAQRDIAHEQRQMTIRMLIKGYADPASAKRLGVSPRTYAGYIADLKEEFEAETRFQLGYTMGQLGISGTDRAEGEPEAPDDEAISNPDSPDV
jgi:sugar-specific transcriptional regulator TrmB